jgi:hypothetical protein
VSFALLVKKFFEITRKIYFFDLLDVADVAGKKSTVTSAKNLTFA